MTQSGQRSVSAGRDITGSIIQTGDGNVANLTARQLPDAASVDITAVIAELRAVLASMTGPDAAKVGRAFEDANEEVAKPEPDKAEVAGILTRALGYAKKAADFSEHVERIKPLVIAAAGWLGTPAIRAPLLAALGLPPV